MGRFYTVCPMKKRHPLLNQVTAYRRLAAKALKNGNTSGYENYTRVADRFYAQYQRQLEWKNRRNR